MQKKWKNMLTEKDYLEMFDWDSDRIINKLLNELNLEKNQDEEMRNSPHFKFIVYTAIRDKGLYNKFVKLDNLSSLIDTYKDTELFQLLLWLNWQIGR